jgi:hypothetical protein
MEAPLRNPILDALDGFALVLFFRRGLPVAQGSVAVDEGEQGAHVTSFSSSLGLRRWVELKYEGKQKKRCTCAAQSL